MSLTLWSILSSGGHTILMSLSLHAEMDICLFLINPSDVIGAGAMVQWLKLPAWKVGD